jgi:hypothetical protein
VDILKKKIVSLLLLSTVLLNACSNNNGITRSDNTNTPRATKAPTSRPASTRKPSSTKIVSFEGCMNVSSVYIRNKPSTLGTPIGGLTGIDCVKIIGRDQYSDWVLIKKGSIEGWVFQSYLSISGNISNLPLISGFSSITQTNLTPVVNSISPSNANNESSSSSSGDQSLPDCNSMWGYVGSFVYCKIPFAYCDYLPAVYGKPTFCNDNPYPNHSFAFVIWEVYVFR